MSVSDKERANMIINGIVLLGIVLVALAIITYSLERLQALDMPWQIQIGVVGFVLVIFGIAGAKMFSR